MRTPPIFIFGIILILFLGIVTAAIGAFYLTDGKPFEVVNQYGDTVKLSGQGIYANDSYFKAPIFQATDLVMLFISVPLLLISSFLLRKSRSFRNRLFNIAVLAVFVYYSASMAFGATFNSLHLAYIALFSSSLFCLVFSVHSFLREAPQDLIQKRLPYKGFYVFLVFSGLALILAWLPDILSANLAGQSLKMIEVYTTEITYVLDMGIIGPSAIVALYLLRKRHISGYILLAMLLTLCAVIGVMLPVQTLYQAQAGILLPLPVMITKVGAFCILAGFAIFYLVRLLAAVKSEKSQPILDNAAPMIESGLK